MDVNEEHLPRDPALPLPDRANAICAPQIGYATREEWDHLSSEIHDRINACAAGPPIHVVKPEMLGRTDPA